MEKRGCATRAKQGGGFAPLCHGTIVGAEKLLVMEFINSDHDQEEVFISAGGVRILCNFACFTRKKGCFLNQKQRVVSGRFVCQQHVLHSHADKLIVTSQLQTCSQDSFFFFSYKGKILSRP